jgi:hypothetical protein
MGKWCLIVGGPSQALGQTTRSIFCARSGPRLRGGVKRRENQAMVTVRRRAEIALATLIERLQSTARISLRERSSR